MAITKISEDLKSAHDYLFEEQTVPQNTTTTGSANLVGGTNGALEVIAKVGDTQIALADTKVITVKLTGSATEGGSYTDVATLYTATASGATTIDAGTQLGQFIPTPETPLYLKAVVTTDDAAATGTLDVYIKHLAR